MRALALFVMMAAVTACGEATASFGGLTKLASSDAPQTPKTTKAANQAENGIVTDSPNGATHLEAAGFYDANVFHPLDHTVTGTWNPTLVPIGAGLRAGFDVPIISQ